MKATFACALLGVAAQAAAGEYKYDTNGADWGDVDLDNNVCDTGRQQSPINLVESGASKDDKMQIEGFNYYNSVVDPAWEANTATTIGLSEGASSSAELEITFPGGSKSSFTPLQFHFHAPSEHAHNGKLNDLEMHIVHQYQNTETELGAVIGVFFDV